MADQKHNVHLSVRVLSLFLSESFLSRGHPYVVLLVVGINVPPSPCHGRSESSLRVTVPPQSESRSLLPSRGAVEEGRR